MYFSKSSVMTGRIVMNRAMHTASNTLVMMKRNFLHTFRNPESIVMTIMLPILVLFVFVYVFGGAIGEGGDRQAYLQYIVPGMVAMQIVFTSYMTSVSVCNDMSKGIIDRFRAMDISSLAVLTGQLFAAVLRNALGIIVMFIAGLLMGFEPKADLMEWLALAGMIILFVSSISWISIMLGLMANSPESASGANMFLQFVPYVSSAFLVTSTMPGWLKAFADNQPFTPIVDTIRALILGYDVGRNGWIAIAWCLGLTVICSSVSMYLYRHKTSK